MTLVLVIIHVEALLIQHKVFVGDLRQRGRVEGRRQGDDDVDITVLRPNWRNLPGESSDRRTLVKLPRTQLEGRDSIEVLGNSGRLASLRIGDGDSGLILAVPVANAHVDAEIDSTTKSQLP